MAEVRQEKWNGRTGGGRFGQRFLMSVLKRINAWWIYPVLYVVIPFYVVFGWRSSRLTYEYFRIRQGYGRGKAWLAVVKNYICFGKVVLDKFAVAAGRSEQFKIEIEGDEYMKKGLNGEKGFILASAHVGNFELVGHCMSQNKKGIYGIIYGGEEREYMERRIESFKKMNVTLIPVAEDMSHLFAIKEALDGGNIVSLQCDRMFGSTKHLSRNFLQGEADFPLGVFRIAAQLEVEVLTVFVLKVGRRKYRALVEPLHWNAECKNSVTQAMNLCEQYVEKLEKIVKEYPLQWFNYYNFWEK